MMTSKRRFTEHTAAFGAVKRLDATHPSLRNATTLYGARVASPTADIFVLKSGEHSRKIGSRVVKGRWRGMPIYTLTLEERATCPRDCQHWQTCFGNKMNWSVRWRAGPALEAKLVEEVAILAREHPSGFVVRLHVLGDFYSVEYVVLWAALIDRHRALHVFGYTARDPERDPIGSQLDAISHARWHRFAVRFSNTWRAQRSSLTLWRPGRIPPNVGIVCPAQTGGTDCCGTCALCWSTRKNIFFQLH